jgi:DNA-binding PadR family transcriptional regulator
MQKAGLAIRIRGLKKEYRLGQIGRTTLQKELKRWWARKRGLEDPYSKIGLHGSGGDQAVCQHVSGHAGLFFQ